MLVAEAVDVLAVQLGVEGVVAGGRRLFEDRVAAGGILDLDVEHEMSAQVR